MSDDRPDFGQALAAAEAAASDGSSPSSQGTSSPEVSGAPTTVAPGAADASGSDTTPLVAESAPVEEPVGPIPLDRHKAILERSRREFEDYKARVGWAEKIPPEYLQQMSSLAQRMASDPVSFAVELVQELQSNPSYATALRSHAARLLASKQGARDEPEPEPDIVVDKYKWFSAEQLAKRDQWLANRLLRDVDQKIAPLTQLKTQWEQREQAVAQEQAATDFARQTYSQARQWPHFEAHKAEIAEVFSKMPPMPDSEVGTAIRDAYIQVLATKVLPALSSNAQQQVIADLRRKAVAGTVSPSSPSPTPTARPKSFEEALRQFSTSG